MQLRRLLVRPLRQRERTGLEPSDALRLGRHLAARRRQRQLGTTPRVALPLELGARRRRRLLARRLARRRLRGGELREPRRELRRQQRAQPVVLARPLRLGLVRPQQPAEHLRRHVACTVQF